MKKYTLLFSICALLSASAWADAPSVDDAVAAIAHRWASITYQTPDADKGMAYEDLATQSQKLAEANPARAEPLVWEAIALSGAAKAEGGLGALGKAKKAKEILLAAQAIDPDAMDGSIYCTLGSLYANVPGWPIGFGDKKTARRYLEKALELDPSGIDANFFYGTFLSDQGEYQPSIEHLKKVEIAPPRPGREDADTGRRAEAKALLAKIESQHPDARGR